MKLLEAMVMKNFKDEVEDGDTFVLKKKSGEEKPVEAITKRNAANQVVRARLWNKYFFVALAVISLIGVASIFVFKPFNVWGYVGAICIAVVCFSINDREIVRLKTKYGV